MLQIRKTVLQQYQQSSEEIINRCPASKRAAVVVDTICISLYTCKAYCLFSIAKNTTISGGENL